MNTTPTEYQECVTLAQWLDYLVQQGKVHVYSHTAQETFTKSWKQKGKNKAMGVRPGVPDYIILTPKAVLFIEMKRKQGNKPTEHQKKWIAKINNSEYTIASVCYGFDEAKEFVEEHL